MRTIFSAQQQFKILGKGKKYNRDSKTFAITFEELVRENLISKQMLDYSDYPNYRYTLTTSAGGKEFSVVGRPTEKGNGERIFFVDQSGTFTYTTDHSQTPDASYPTVD